MNDQWSHAADDPDDYDPPGDWHVTPDMERAGYAALLRARFAGIPEEAVPQYVYRRMRDEAPLRWDALHVVALAYVALDLATTYPRWAIIAVLAWGAFLSARACLRNLRGRA